jgi:hypothetical protein
VGLVKVLSTNFSLIHTVGGQDVPVGAIPLGNPFTALGGYITFDVTSAVSPATVLRDELWSTLFLDTGRVTQLVILTGADRDHLIESYGGSRPDVVSHELHTALLKAEVLPERARAILLTARTFLKELGFSNSTYTVEDRFDIEDEVWLVTARFLLDVSLDLAKRLVASHDDLPYRFLVTIDAA